MKLRQKLIAAGALGMFLMLPTAVEYGLIAQSTSAVAGDGVIVSQDGAPASTNTDGTIISQDGAPASTNTDGTIIVEN